LFLSHRPSICQKNSSPFVVIADSDPDLSGDKESGGEGDLLNPFFQRSNVLLNVQGVNRSRPDNCVSFRYRETGTRVAGTADDRYRFPAVP
jgi:hypothetical protein